MLKIPVVVKQGRERLPKGGTYIGNTILRFSWRDSMCCKIHVRDMRRGFLLAASLYPLEVSVVRKGMALPPTLHTKKLRLTSKLAETQRMTVKCGP